MSSLDALSGIEFEGLITQLLERMGFRAEMTKASGDGGVDVVATLDHPVTGGRYLIQCKRYAPDSPVGAATVREFYGVLTADRRAVKGILITTSGFTAQALEFAGGLPLELIGRGQLQRLLDQHGLHTDLLGPHPGSIVGAPSRPNDRVSELLALAGNMMQLNRHAEAVKLFREVTLLRPDDSNAWHQLGVCYSVVGLHDDAIAAHRMAVRLRPDLGPAWFGLGFSLRQLGDWNAAGDALEQALKVERNVYVLIERGEVYWHKADNERAHLAFEEAVQVDPANVHAWWRLGEFRYAVRQNSEAISALHEALRIDPNHGPSWLTLFYVYHRQMDRPRMVQAVRGLERVDPAKARDLRRDLLDE